MASNWNDNTFFAWHFGDIYYVTLLPSPGKEVNAYLFNASIHKSKSLVDGLHTFVIIYLNVLHGRIFLSLRMTPDYATLDKLYSTSYFVFDRSLLVCIMIHFCHMSSEHKKQMYQMMRWYGKGCINWMYIIYMNANF